MRIVDILVEDDRKSEDEWDRSYLNAKVSGEFKRAISRLRKEPNHEYMGSGTSAYVGRTNDPHSQDSVTRLSSPRSGGSVWLQTIASQPGLYNNPFLPRVIKVGKQSPTQRIVVERLVPLNAPKIIGNILLMKSLWEMYFTVDFPADEELRYLDGYFAGVISGVAHGDDPMDHIRDADLAQAIQLIQTIRKQTKFFLDLHERNMMWRITGNMPQLVITDPLA